MDPYLEDPARWPDFHTRFVGGLCDALGERLAPDYLVRLDERVYVTDEAAEVERIVRPDVTLSSLYRSSRTAAAPAGVVALEDEVEAPFYLPALGPEEHREVFLVIKLRNMLDVVTIVELLSPVNKRPVSVGRDEYIRKREQVLHSRTSLVELDLLRAGARVPMGVPLPPAHYYALIHRARRRPMCEVHPFTVREPLPEIAIPLRDREQVRIALQPIFETCYARARYDLEVDYSRPPIPPLSPDDAAWAAERVS
jgi:hypothetical protein